VVGQGPARRDRAAGRPALGRAARAPPPGGRDDSHRRAARSVRRTRLAREHGCELPQHGGLAEGEVDLTRPRNISGSVSRLMWLAACRVLAIHSGELRNGCVEVTDGRIARVDDGDPPAGAETIALGGLTLAPGLISCHTHLSVVYPFSATDEDEPPALTAMRALSRARDALEAGVTTIRCLLEIHRIELDLRRAAADGRIE